MQLSRFFTLAEMTRSETAERENISNQPGEGEIDRLRALCSAMLDPLREAIGQGIRVNSGYRSPALNRRIGGASNSQHVEGRATDIQSPGMPVLELFKTIIRLGLPFDQLIYEAKSATAKWVHVSHNPAGNRGQIMKAKFSPDGRPIAYPTITRDEALAMTEPAVRGFGTEPLEYLEMPDEPLPIRRARKAREKPGTAPARKTTKAAKKPASKKAVKRGATTRSSKKPMARAPVVAKKPTPKRKTAKSMLSTGKNRGASKTTTKKG